MITLAIMITLATTSTDIGNWITTAAVVAGMIVPMVVSAWLARDWFEKHYVRIEDFNELKQELKDVSERTQRSLEHRAAADLARWEKLEMRYEKIFEALFDRRRKL